MKVNDPNQAGLGGVTSVSVSKSTFAGRSSSAAGAGANGEGDGVHLSSLARSLAALESNSPERQARVEYLARAYAGGQYQADAEATAGGVIDDALKQLAVW